MKRLVSILLATLALSLGTQAYAGPGHNFESNYMDRASAVVDGGGY